MNLFQKINNYGEFIPLRNLELHKYYKISEFKYYNDKLTVCLDGSLRVFLPDRFAKNITMEDVDELNRKDCALLYEGMKSISRDRSMHCVKIVESCDK